jgi:Flp pilus assembly protein TadD
MSPLTRNTTRLAALLLTTAALSGCGALSVRPNTTSDANRPSLLAARNALQEGQSETALAIAHGVLTAEPHNLAALVSAADADMQLDNRRTAEREYRQALQADPHYVPALLGVGKMKMRDDVKGAEAAFRAVLASNPRNAAALTDLGVTLDLQEHHAEAQAEYLKAIAVNPDLTSPRVNLAVSIALSGDAAKAEQMMRDTAESGPVPAKVRADYALTEVLAGHADQAEQTLQADLSADEAKASVDAMTALMPTGQKAKN